MRIEMNLKVAVTIIFGLSQFGVVLVNGADAGTQKCFPKTKDFSPPIFSGKVGALRNLVKKAWENLPDLQLAFEELLFLFEENEGGGEISDSKSGGGNVSGGGKGGGDDDDDQDDRKGGNEKWNNMKKEAPVVKKYGGENYYQSKCGEFWYTKDRAGHAGAYLKKYKDKGSTLEFVGSVDKDFKDMTSKHESTPLKTIRKSDMDTVNR